MDDLISEIIGFTIVTLVVIMLAFFTKRMEDKYKEDEKN